MRSLPNPQARGGPLPRTVTVPHLYCLFPTQVASRLQELYKQYGYFVYRSSFFIVDRPEQSKAVFDRLRAGGQYPQVRGEGAGASVEGSTVHGLRAEQGAVLFRLHEGGRYSQLRGGGRGLALWGLGIRVPGASSTSHVMEGVSNGGRGCAAALMVICIPKVPHPVSGFRAHCYYMMRACVHGWSWQACPPPHCTQDVGGVPVLSVRDLGVGLDSGQPDGRATLPWREGDMMLTLRLEGGASLTLRASGGPTSTAAEGEQTWGRGARGISLVLTLTPPLSGCRAPAGAE